MSHYDTHTNWHTDQVANYIARTPVALSHTRQIITNMAHYSLMSVCDAIELYIALQFEAQETTIDEYVELRKVDWEQITYELAVAIEREALK